MSFKLGKISDLANPFTVAVFFLQFFLIIGYFSYKYYMDSSESCIQCHGSKKKMIELGYPQFYRISSILYNSEGCAKTN